MRRYRHRRGGFTIVEVSIAIGLLGFVVFGVHGLLESTQSSYRRSSSASTLEERGSRIVDRIVAELRCVDPDTVLPRVAPPLSRSEIHYRKKGIDDLGAVLLGDPLRLRLEPGTDRLVLTERPGALDERDVVWCRSVAALLAGETANGIDDNGNGLIDEPGLCFTFEGEVCRVQLTLEAQTRGGLIQRTFEGRAVQRISSEGGGGP